MNVRALAMRGLKMLALIIVGFVLLMIALLSGCQRSLIYYPSRYQKGIELVMPERAERIDFRTAQGAQAAIYIAPQEGDRVPDRLWVCGGGNASQAIDWSDLIKAAPDPRAGYLLVDYPGYGWCEGHPTRATIGHNMTAAFKALAENLGVERKALEAHLGLLGHSIGSAVVLDFSREVNVERAVLISPFTTLQEMARMAVGPLSFLLTDRYDNGDRLAELGQRNPRPSVTIIHGTADQVIPYRMATELAERFDWVKLVTIQNGDHNWIIDSARAQILSAMAPADSISSPTQPAE